MLFDLSLSAILICAGAALAGGFIDAVAGGGGADHHARAVARRRAAASGPGHQQGQLQPGHRRGARQLRPQSSGALAAGSGRIALFPAGSLRGLTPDALCKQRNSGQNPGRPSAVGMCATLLPKKNRTQPPLALEGPLFWSLVPLVCLLIGAYDGFFGPGTWAAF